MQDLKRVFCGLGLAAVLVFCTVAAFCSRQSFISNSQTVYDSYIEAKPVLAQLGISTVNIDAAATIGNDLIAAFRDNQNANAVNLIAALIARTNLILSTDVSLIKDEGQRARVMAILALGNIALHWLANNILKVVADTPALASRAGGSTGSAKSPARSESVGAAPVADSTGALATIKAFASEPVWGKQYVH